MHKGDGICWGCNPVLLEMGISCEDQPTELEMSNSNEEMAHWRDCSCNSNCILYDNCCQDFQDTCPHFYKGEYFKLLSLHKCLFIKTVQTMVIVMIYGTLKWMGYRSTCIIQDPAVAKPFKVHTTA